MAYFPDLSPYCYIRRSPAALNIGWLDVNHPYTQGKVAAELVETLRTLAITQPKNRMRGFHICNLCNKPQNADGRVVIRWGGREHFLGSAEIWVKDECGTAFAAPNLIVHYIEAHGYLPPAEFLRALARI